MVELFEKITGGFRGLAERIVGTRVLVGREIRASLDEIQFVEVAISALEEMGGSIGFHYGSLLRRSGRTLRMTHAGAVFKPHLDAMLHHFDDGIAAVSQLIDPDTGAVVLAFQQSLGTWLVPDLVRSFRAARPGVGFRLIQVRDEPQSPALDGGTPTWRSAAAGLRSTRACTRR